MTDPFDVQAALLGRAIDDVHEALTTTRHLRQHLAAYAGGRESVRLVDVQAGVDAAVDALRVVGALLVAERDRREETTSS